MTDIVMRRTATGLEPIDVDALAKIKIGTEVMVKVVKPRSIKQHRLFWKLLTYVSDATDFETPEQLLVSLKIALGRYDLMKLMSGKVVPVPKSIAFESMDGVEFRKFFDDSMHLICRDVLPGVSPEEMIGAAGLTSAVAEMRADPPVEDTPPLHPDAVYLIKAINSCKDVNAKTALMNQPAMRAKYKALSADQQKAVKIANDAANQRFEDAKADAMIERAAQG